MLVMIEKQQDEPSWVVTALQGKYGGCKVAIVDGISLERVRFEGRFIIGEAKAIWGAAINPRYTDDYETVRGIGVGSTFKTAHQNRRAIFNGEYYESETKRQLKKCGRLFVMNEGVFYDR